MIRRISNSVNHAHRGVQKVVPIQVITPSKGSGQDEKENGKMRNGVPPGLDLSTAAEPQQPEVRVLGSDANDRQHRQKYETALQELIERKTKEVKPHIDSKDGSGNPKEPP